MMRGLLATHLRILSENLLPDEDIGEQKKQELNKFIEEIGASFVEKVQAREIQMISDTIAIYEKHLTVEEMLELLKFYNSPVGKRMTELMPVFQMEMAAIGEHYGKEITAEITNELEAQELREREKKLRKIEKELREMEKIMKEREKQIIEKQMEKVRLAIDLALNPQKAIY